MILFFKVIDDSHFSTHGTEIILLSDNKRSSYFGIVHTLKQKGITVNTISVTRNADSVTRNADSVTRNADSDITKLAAETGGKSYTYLKMNSMSLADVLSQAISAGTTDIETIEKVFSHFTRKSTSCEY